LAASLETLQLNTVNDIKNSYSVAP